MITLIIDPCRNYAEGTVRDLVLEVVHERFLWTLYRVATRLGLEKPENVALRVTKRPNGLGSKKRSGYTAEPLHPIYLGNIG